MLTRTAHLVVQLSYAFGSWSGEVARDNALDPSLIRSQYHVLLAQDCGSGHGADEYIDVGERSLVPLHAVV